MRRIRTSLSHPNLPSHSTGPPSPLCIPPVPPLRVPLTPTSPTNTTFSPTSPQQHFFSPISATFTDSPGTDIGSALSTSPLRTLPQLRSMDTLSLPSEQTAAATDGRRSNPASPVRKPPTTRSIVLARKKAEAAAVGISPADNSHHSDSYPAPSNMVGIGEPTLSIVISPPPNAEPPPPKARLDTSAKMVLHSMELNPSSSTTGAADDATAARNDLAALSPAKQATSFLSASNTNKNQSSTNSHPLFPRNYTLSTASAPSFATTTYTSPDHAHPAPAPMRSTPSFSASSASFKRFNTAPVTPPVPVVPEKYRYQPSTSAAAPTSESHYPGHIPTAAVVTGESTSIAAIKMATPVELSIAVTGVSKCGKSEFIWKGMKVWGLDPSSTSDLHCGINVIKRVALPSISPNATTSQPKAVTQAPLERFVECERLIDVDDDSASTIHERRRIAKVTLYEVDSAALFAQRDVIPPRKGSAGSEDSSYGDGRTESEWVWPTCMPRIDGVMLCYDASDVKTTDKLEELCGKLYLPVCRRFCWFIHTWCPCRAHECMLHPKWHANQSDIQHVSDVLIADARISLLVFVFAL